MTIQVEFWQLVGLAFTAAGLLGGLAKMLLASVQASIAQRFTSLDSAVEAQRKALELQIAGLATQQHSQQAALGRLERELLDLKAELPRDYVRREDYTQAIATISTKLDAMALRFENILLGGSQHGR